MRVSGRHGETRYLIDLDAALCCRSLEVSSGSTALSLNRTKAGWLDAEAALIRGTAACVDVDLGWTALTNTFPIRRLTAAKESKGTFPVIMITASDFEMSVVEQSYTRKDDGWLYQNVESGVSALLSVDRHGLVIDYPDLCTRKDFDQ